MTCKDYIPFGKPNFSDEEIAAVTRVMRSGWVGMGPETILFEQELSEFLSVPHVVTVNSCTSALFLSLLVSGFSRSEALFKKRVLVLNTRPITLSLWFCLSRFSGRCHQNLD